MTDQIKKGLDVIRTAAVAALADRRVPGARVDCHFDGQDRPGGILTIAAGTLVETTTFTYDELEDSGEAIDAPAAVKVRMLVSKFVR